MNKIAVVMMCKNEEDVIESFVRHAVTFADDILVCDHMSTDRTTEILELLKKENLPIQIYSHDENSQDQKAVMTRLVNQAIDRGANIVVPTDADEFLIMTEGRGSRDIKNLLGMLDASQIYEVKWTQCVFVDPEKDQDQFTLSRPTLCSTGKNEFAIWPKVIIGSVAWNRLKLSMERGNHFVALPNGERFEDFIELSALESWHYRYRSEAQWLSKDLCKFLTRILIHTRYGALGGVNMKYNVHKFLAGKSFDINDIEHMYNMHSPIPADNILAPYKHECELKYSTNFKGNPLRNVFSLAVSIANECKLKDIIDLRKVVRIFVFHDGDSERTNISIRSALKQTYPHKKIFVVLVNRNQIKGLDYREGISFIDVKDFPDIIVRKDGEYVQFISAGDRLLKEKISHMIEFLFARDQCDAVFSEVITPEFRGSLPIFTQTTYFETGVPVWDHYRDRILIPGSWFFECFILTGQALKAGFSRGFFKQKIFNDKSLIQSWILGGDIKARQLMLWTSLIDIPEVCFLNEQLVETDESHWSKETLTMFYEIWARLVEQMQGSIILPSERYQMAKKELLKCQTKLSQL